MLVAAQDYTPEIQSKLATVIAIQEVGGIVRGGANYIGWQTHVTQKQSDLLAQYDVLMVMPQILPDTYEVMGIIAKNIDKAEEVVERLHRDLGLEQGEMTVITPDEAAQLMRAIVAGQIHQLWMVDDHGRYEHVTTHQQRELSSSSVVRGVRLVSGTPFDLEVPTRGGELETLHLLQNVTVVDTKWLLELSPERFATRKPEMYYDPRLGGLARRQRVRFGKMVLEGTVEPVMDTSSQSQHQFVDAFTDWAHGKVDRELRILGRYNRNVPNVTRSQVQQYVRMRSPWVTNLQQLEAADKRALLAAAEPETYLGRDFRVDLERKGNRSEQHHHPHEHRRRGWQPQHKRKYKRDKW